MVSVVSYGERGPRFDSPPQPFSKKLLDINSHLQTGNHSDTGHDIAYWNNLDDVMAGFAVQARAL